MDLINICLLSIFTIDLILILITLTDNKKWNRITFWYAVNVFTISIWVINMVMFRLASTSDILIYSRLLYVTASFIVSTFYYFTFIFPHPDKNYKVQGIIVAVADFIVSYLALFTNTIVTDAKINRINENEFYPGNLYWLYAIYIFIFLSLSFLRLFIKSFRSSDKNERAQLLFLALGYTLSGIVPMFTNLILPWIGINNYNWIGPTATILMVFFFTYAVTKYKLFNLKIITAEVFIFALWIFTAIKTFLPTNIDSPLLKISFFILTILVGVQLIRSVKNEVKQREKLKELDELKSEFISLATHHISSPLTAINGYVSLLQEGSFGKVPNEMNDTLSILQRSTQNLTTIVRDFLDISKIETEGIQYSFSYFDINIILENVIDALKHTIKQNVNLSYSKDEKSEYIIYGDEKRISQAIRNILENSIKYTTNGEIKIELNNEDDKVIIKISDTGVRKLPVMSEKLAHKFTTSNNKEEASIIGNGLGIYVAKQIIEAQSGHLLIETKNSITIFKILLSNKLI